MALTGGKNNHQNNCPAVTTLLLFINYNIVNVYVKKQTLLDIKQPTKVFFLY